MTTFNFNVCILYFKLSNIEEKTGINNLIWLFARLVSYLHQKTRKKNRFLNYTILQISKFYKISQVPF